MAKIVVEIDTESKNIVTKVNDTVIPNVSRISASIGGEINGKPSYIDCSIDTYEKVDDNTTKSVTYYSWGSQMATAALKAGAKASEFAKDIVEYVKSSSTISSISEFISKKINKI